MTAGAVGDRPDVEADGPPDLEPKPSLRGRFHQVAFFVAVPAGVTLITLAHTATARTAAAVYAGSLAALYGVSSAYHRLRWPPKMRAWMKRADHSMIYVLIAGTTTPFAVLALRPPWSFVLLLMVWMGAALGIALKVVRVDGFAVLTGTLYIVLGWSTLVFAPQMIHRMSAPGVALVVLGGLLYTGGAIVLLRRRPDPAPATFGYHEIWHSCVVAASACHYVAVLLLVLPARPALG
jgi:hemolysin III